MVAIRPYAVAWTDGDQCVRARAKHGLPVLNAAEIVHAYEGPNPPAVAQSV